MRPHHWGMRFLILGLLLVGHCGGSLPAVGSASAIAQNCEPVEVQGLEPEGVHDDAACGYAVALLDDVALVGVPFDDRHGTDAGAVIAYRYTDGQWVEESALTATDPYGSGDWFGYCLALSEEFAVIGAPHDDIGEPNSGSVYVFHRDGEQWSEYAKLLASDGGDREEFGCSVSIADDTIVIGASRADVGSKQLVGAAYVFQLIGSDWVQVAKLAAPDRSFDDGFGYAVAIAGDSILVGAPRRITYSHLEVGAVYAFHWDGSQWGFQQKLLPPAFHNFGKYGYAVAMTETSALIGEPRSGNRTGMAYLLTRENARWTQECRLRAPDAVGGDGFGAAVAMSGHTAVIGAPWLDAGALYIAQWDRRGCVISSTVEPEPGEVDDQYGASVALAGGQAIVGTPGDDEGGIRDRGSARVIALNCAPVLFTLGSCPGPMRFKVEDVTPGSRVAYLYAEGEGSIVIPPEYPCAGLTLRLNRTVHLVGVAGADDLGKARLDVNVPASACGRVYVQAVDLTTCDTSNVVKIQ
ncbi:MAG: hypothetical protein HND57_13065 [Planctomycetes bacterium]|nr:hypothetical protein [Planctomycetota bacterium]